MGLEMTTSEKLYIAFAGHTRVASGTLWDVARMVRAYHDAGEITSVTVLDASTSAPVDLDLRGTPEEVKEKAVSMAAAIAGTSRGSADPSKPGPGRPKLGVVGREVTLLPRHWDWLRAQPGGASVTLRKLVEAARKEGQGAEAIRKIQDRTYGFMHTIAGDLPGFEEASRALYAWDLKRLEELIRGWPQDVRDHTIGLGRLES